ncbi:MAG: tripartite tricarboxylate transporter substrate binding protein, partial [Betaproteobacteria bacterium]
ATAQHYPTKPLRMIVPFAPGGPSGNLAYALSQKLSESMRQRVIVDNRPGAGGSIAAVIAAKSAPDGYTLFAGTISTLATNVSMYSKLPYDPLRDFEPITLTAATPYFVVVHPSVPVSSLGEFIAFAKSKPGGLNFASSGSGGGAHLAVEMFKSMAEVKITHVAYKGGAPAMLAVMAGDVQMSFSQPPIVLPQAQSGKLRVLAVSSAQRLAIAPQVPTMSEAGVRGYEATSWSGMLTTAGTPKPIVTKLHAEFRAALHARDLREQLASEGSEPGGISPSEFAAYIRREIVKWAKVVRESGAKAD